MAAPAPIRAVSGDTTKHSIRMAADRLLVHPSDELGERKSRAGILIPATADVSKRLVWAEVVQVGPTVRNVEAGGPVLFAPAAGFEGESPAEEDRILRGRGGPRIASARAGGPTGPSPQ